MDRRGTESRADSAYRQLLAFIEDEDLPDGTRLPSEAEFVAKLGLSRTIIREALARLRAEGRAVSRRGAGTFTVRQVSTQLLTLTGIDTVQDLIDWHEFRTALESEVAALAAERRTPADLDALRAAQDRLVGKLSDEYAEGEDVAFHTAIAACAHNAKLLDAVGRLATHIFRWNRFSRERGILTVAERRELITLEHGDIIAAIADRDPDRARSMIRRHLLNGRARMLSAVAS